jgi:tetratricopeptide (TPR) repeat protein
MTKLIRAGAVVLTVLVAAPFAGAQDNVEQMVRDLREQARQNPDRLDLRLALGNTAVLAKNYDLAIETFKEVLAAVEPDSPEAGDVQLRIGETSRRKGDLEGAATALRRAGELLPDNPTVLGMLALVLDMAGKFPEAEEAYRTALKLDPENAVTLNNLAYLLAMHGGRPEEALALATKAHELVAGTSDFADTLAVVHTRMGHTAEAMTILRDLVGKEPGNEEFRRHLAAAMELRPGGALESEQELLAALKAEASAENVARVGELVKK